MMVKDGKRRENLEVVEFCHLEHPNQLIIRCGELEEKNMTKCEKNSKRKNICFSGFGLTTHKRLPESTIQIAKPRGAGRVVVLKVGGERLF